MMQETKDKHIETLSKTITSGKGPPGLMDIFSHTMKAVGGYKAFGNILADELKTEKSKNNNARTRTLDMMLRLMRHIDDKYGDQTDVTLLSEEDLDREIRDALIKVMEMQEMLVEPTSPTMDNEPQAG